MPTAAIPMGPPGEASRDSSPPRDRAPAGLLRYFQISLLCTLATALGALSSTGRVEPPAVALFSAVLLVRLAILASGRDWRLSAGAVTAFAVCYLCFYPLDLFYLARGPSFLDRTLAATVHLVLFASAVKVLAAASRRDYAYLAILSFIMMLAAAILTVGAVFVAAFGLYLLFAISTLLSYEVLRPLNGAAPEDRPRVEAPAASVDVRVETALGKTALTLTLALVPVAALLFFLIPRYRSGYWARMALEPQRISGFGETVDLGDFSKILQSSQVVMRVTPEGDPRFLEGGKLRGVALTNFDGRRWSNPGRGGQIVMPVVPHQFRPPDLAGLASGRPEIARYRVLLEPVSADVLFVAGRPRVIEAPLRFMLVDKTGSLLDPQRTQGPFAYEVISDAASATPVELRQSGGDRAETAGQQYLELPRLDPRIAELARRITAGSGNNYDRASALRDYLQGHFSYTLDLPPVDPAQPLVSFLFETKRGNCEFFAAALAVMLRTLGIPARLVNGFEMGAYNPVGKDFVVRGRDAHSWVEVYFPKRGWAPFDPTPAGADAGSSLLIDYLDAAELFWNEWVVNYDFGRQVQLAVAVETRSRRFNRRFVNLRRRFERLGVRLAGSAQNWLGARRYTTLAWIIILLALATLAVRHRAWIAELRAALAWRFAARGRPPSPHAASVAYQRFLCALARSGLEKRPAETPLEFARAFRHSTLRQHATAFTELYQAARFGHESVPLATLEASLEAAVAASRPSKES